MAQPAPQYEYLINAPARKVLFLWNLHVSLVIIISDQTIGVGDKSQRPCTDTYNRQLFFHGLSCGGWMLRGGLPNIFLSFIAFCSRSSLRKLIARSLIASRVPGCLLPSAFWLASNIFSLKSIAFGPRPRLLWLVA